MTYGAQSALTDTDVLEIDGFFHLAGMVSSGKTTLAKLIIAHAILNGWDFRVTLLTGDTNSAIQIANEFNRWFRDSPEMDDPVAVPLFGQSSRETHITRFENSRDYQDSRDRGQTHWGERFLSRVCPLNALIKWDIEDGGIIEIGKEPCERLDEVTSTDDRAEKHRAVCPFFATCPSKQAFRDMPKAKLWVTTAGAFAKAKAPKPLDSRHVLLRDIIYEQSDLVIIDEAETVIDWFDREYAVENTLTDGEKGWLDTLDRDVSNYLMQHRTAPRERQQWSFAVRAAAQSVSAVLSIQHAQEPAQRLARVDKWVRRGSFTRNKLSFRLARRLGGLKEYELRTDLPIQLRLQEREIERTNTRIFEALNDLESIFDIRPKAGCNVPDATLALTIILQHMNRNEADNATLVDECKSWITTYFPDTEANLDALRQSLEISDHHADQRYLKDELVDRDAGDMAEKLLFTLYVAILDWHLRKVKQQWHHKPPEISSRQLDERMSGGVRAILPIPAIGELIGLYKTPHGKPGARVNLNQLKQFEYTNIGRAFILNFHRLRTDLDGERGPNVLAMSGTSYLPDSSRFNVQRLPDGVLEPDKQAKAALSACTFAFRPFYNTKNKPISVSGIHVKEAELSRMMRAMLDIDRATDGFFGEILADIDAQQRIDPDRWTDRRRILVFTNSYSQAEAAAKTLQHEWPVMAKYIYYLKRGREEDFILENTIERVDIERFAQTDGVILIAPMPAVGRGFNILNQHYQAAFGAVVFLIRPMFMPDDMPAMAQELNRYTLQWAARQSLPASLENLPGVYENAIGLREAARELWRSIELRYSYQSLLRNDALNIEPRHDLAATTAGLIIQAIGRLLRGDVPFFAYFTDAAWAPETAKKDSGVRETEETSLLQALINVLCRYADENDAPGYALYHALAEVLCGTTGLNLN